MKLCQDSKVIQANKGPILNSATHLAIDLYALYSRCISVLPNLVSRTQFFY